MSYVNDVRIIGELVEDGKIVTSNGKKYAILKIKTGRPYKNAKGESSWTFLEHNVKCLKEDAFGMIEKYAKKGKWMKVSGELSVSSDRSIEIVIGRTTGDIGMMFSVLGPQETEVSHSEDVKDAATKKEEMTDSKGEATRKLVQPRLPKLVSSKPKEPPLQPTKTSWEQTSVSSDEDQIEEEDLPDWSPPKKSFTGGGSGYPGKILDDDEIPF